MSDTNDHEDECEKARAHLDVLIERYRIVDAQVTLAALFGMAHEARHLDANARYCVLEASDQGPHYWWMDIRAADGTVLAEDMPDDYSWASNVADSTWLLVRLFERDNADENLNQVWIDIEKVLAEITNGTMALEERTVELLARAQAAK